jgi:hypothetical protein
MVGKLFAVWMSVSGMAIAAYVVAAVLDMTSAHPVGPYAGRNLYLTLALAAWVMVGFFGICAVIVGEAWREK